MNLDKLPSISLVIPNYNSGEVLARAIDSVRAQSYPRLQLIMADGGSTDSFRTILESNRDLFDVVISERDRGQADAINKGFRSASGEILGWLCSDDELAPGALHHVGRLFCERPDVQVITGQCERIYPDQMRSIIPAEPTAFAQVGLRNRIEQPSTFWRRELFDAVGGLDESFHLAFDWDLWARFAKAGGKLLTTDVVLSRYYFSETNKSSAAGAKHVREAVRIIRKYGRMGPLTAGIQSFIFHAFDMKGCLDSPPTSSRWRLLLYKLFRRGLLAVRAHWLLQFYNFHFASRQARGLVWWR